MRAHHGNVTILSTKQHQIEELWPEKARLVLQERLHDNASQWHVSYDILLWSRKPVFQQTYLELVMRYILFIRFSRISWTKV